ncbi:MAG: 6-bladed beta-propeller [Candidatus Aminicenantes bacterium]|nr:MAG: 6-bladed beta-propeller [Candidatus Aminicenantes bacterium]
MSQILSIDTENDELVNYGLNDIWGFDVNSSGDIFIFKHPLSQKDFILKFSGNGEFIKSFGNNGQGPGEIQNPIYQRINLSNEVCVVDAVGRKLVVFDENGDIINESKAEVRISGTGLLLPLTNGNYLYRKVERGGGKWDFVLSLINSNFKEIVELGRISTANIRRASQIKYPFPVLTWGLSNMYIFVGVEERGYDIHVYDFEGTLTRKIRKEYTSAPFSEESQRRAIKRWEDIGYQSEEVVTPKSNPPFQHLFADDNGRLYVATFEPGYNTGEFMIDVFDTEGVLFSRLSLRLLLNGEIIWQDTPTDSWVTVKNNILYCIQEKESGHKKLVAYEIKWQ